MTSDADEAQKAFDVAAQIPEAWLDLAKVHKQLVDGLWPKDFIPPFSIGNLMVGMHHAGMAVENLLKGILIAKRSELVTGGKLDPKKVLTHELPAVAREAGITTDAQEALLLARRGLGYRSQRKGREARGLEKAARIKQQLGGSGDYADPDPERPKGMHRRTYERLCNEVEKAELPYQDRIMKRLHGFLAPELFRPTRRARGRRRTKNSRSPRAPRRRR